MAIGNAAKKAKVSTTSKEGVHAEEKEHSNARARTRSPLEGHEERAATLRLYVKDRNLLKQAKIAALEDDTSLSQLWEDWAIQWLQTR